VSSVAARRGRGSITPLRGVRDRRKPGSNFRAGVLVFGDVAWSFRVIALGRGDPWVPLVVAGLGLAPGCVFDLPSVVPGDDAGVASGADPGCTAAAPRRCGYGCLPDDTPCIPENVAGTYEATLVGRSNECRFEGFGEQGSVGVAPVTVEQTGADVTVRADGLAGLFLSLGFGGEPVFIGTVTGDELVARYRGNRSFTEGGCTWTVEATIEAQATGSRLVGDLVYRPLLNDHPDCASLPVAGCRAIQRLDAVPMAPPE